jgi:hypothetical protein
MQNAIAFGYCVKHKRVAINTSLLKNYTGNYVYYENSKKQEVANISSKGGKLFITWDQPGSIPEELVPMGNDEFFSPANERMVIHFNKKELILREIKENKEYSLVKE